MKVLCALLLVTVVSCTPIDFDDSWDLFKQVHGKQYNSRDEEFNR